MSLRYIANFHFQSIPEVIKNKKATPSKIKMRELKANVTVLLVA